MKYTLYYSHAKLKAVKEKRLRGNTGIVHLSIVRWNLLKRNIQLQDRGIDFCIEQCKNKIRKGPCYICCVCNRLLYKRSVHIFGKSKYSCQTIFTLQSSFDGKQSVKHVTQYRHFLLTPQCHYYRTDSLPTFNKNNPMQKHSNYLTNYTH